MLWLGELMIGLKLKVVQCTLKKFVFPLSKEQTYCAQGFDLILKLSTFYVGTTNRIFSFAFKSGLAQSSKANPNPLFGLGTTLDTPVWSSSKSLCHSKIICFDLLNLQRSNLMRLY